MSESSERDPRLYAIPDTHGHAKGEHKPYLEERPLPLTARMLFLWFYHACRRGYPRFLMVADHMNYLTFEDPAAVNLVRRALKLAQAGDLYGAAETANVEVGHAAVVSEGLRRGMRYSIGAEVDNDPRSRPDAQNIVEAMKPDGIIRSVHFIPIAHPVHGENWPWPFDNPEFKELFETVGTERTWELYVNALVDAIERLPGHIVGHFFVPAVFGHWPDDATLSGYEDRVLAAADARGMAVEFNTRFLYREPSAEARERYLAANKRFLRKAKARGVQIAIGSDAHSPKDQGGAFDVVLSVLDELEINEIVFPMGGTLRRVALRVVREPEPEPEPKPEPAPPDGTVVGDETAAVAQPAKPVRKARPAAKATRARETSPERPPERPESPAPPAEAPRSETTPPAAPAGAAAPPAEASTPVPVPPEPAAPAPAQEHAAAAAAPVEQPAPRPARPSRPARPAAEAPARAPAEPEPPAKPEPAKAAPAKPVPANAAPAKAAPAKPPAAKAAAKPTPVKPVPAKSAPAKPAAKPAAAAKPPASKSATAKKAAPAKPAAKKAAPAKGGAKKSAAAKPAAKKPSPARPAAKKGSAAKKAAPSKRPAAKKAAPSRAPAKKAVAKKASAKKAPARGKKTTTKKTATKRR